MNEGPSSLLLPFDGMKTPEKSLDSGSATPMASSESAQKSLSFLQGLDSASLLGDPLAPSLSQNSSFTTGDYASFVDMDNLGEYQDSFLLQEPFSTCSSSSSFNLDPFSSADASGQVKLPSETGSQGSLCNFASTPSFSSSTLAAKMPPPTVASSYTGFSVQGGRIPSIPCDTGVSHPPSDPPDPLSPNLEGPQSTLPPPLLPTTSTESSADAKKEDKLDKMVNLLGDIVETFDNLL